MTTAFERYRQLHWTTDHDECENACGTIMSEDTFAEGELGFYCSELCRAKAEDGPAAMSDAEERRWEHRQMGIEA